MTIAQTVADELEEALHRSPDAFVKEVGERAHQLSFGMVDGRVLPEADRLAVREAILATVRDKALPALTRRSPTWSLSVLDRLRAYQITDLEALRPEIERARAAEFPPPSPLDWPEIDQLRQLAVDADVCSLGSPVQSICFAHDLKREERLGLPDDVLQLYAAADGFDLSCATATYLPVFSFLPSESIDVSERSGRYPRRLAVFHGGDEVQLCVYRDGSKSWWLVYEYEYEPIAKRKLNLRELLRFAIRRVKSDPDELIDEMSWEGFFETHD